MDLANKPDWFLAISPLGKTPVLKVDDGAHFSLVDAVFGPVFRYFDVFDRIGDYKVITGKPKVAAWRGVLAMRPSVKAAVGGDYEARLWSFLEARKSQLSRLMNDAGAPRPGSGH